MTQDADSAHATPEEPSMPARDTGTLGKLMRLLELVAMQDRPLRFSEILTLSGEPRGTVHRQLGHLLAEGLLEASADCAYRPGIRLMSFAARAWAANDFRSIAAPHLQRLHEETGETVHLGVLRGQEVIYLDKVEGRQSVRMYSQIGRASPVYCTSIGKAALSLLPPEEASRLIGSLQFHPFTSSTIASGQAMERELQVIREAGHALDRQEHEEGIRCVAAPVRGGGPDAAAGISVTGPAFRISEAQLEFWAPSVRATAAAITRDVELRMGPGQR